MPEFGTIAMVVFAIAIVGIIAVTAKSRLTSNNTTLDIGGKTTMSDTLYKLAMIGILGIIVFGAYMAISGYNTDIYPLDRIRGNLDGIVSSSDPDVIRDHLVAIQSDLDLVMMNIPETTDESGKIIAKNPVWIFGTESTNFIRIQNNIDTMFAGLDEISSLSKDNSAYHTGMLDINDRALLLKTNIMDATPYMYVSPANMMFSAIWIAAIIGIIAILKRKKVLTCLFQLHLSKLNIRH
ncbi:PEFG-CTERM sorting domain-containing protein [Candidatus Nitrosopumilus sediminis]|uniref:PEFG-CTERM sorting domain-containing protein n=1 Tax=Candidatus Nitrosopumilus sediminis TaxID=1229909 RepID=UPI00064FBE79|nr:PEFG-CTERM sorting domain-containing protein [Candidatus Nitrosopumilus sediminis]